MKKQLHPVLKYGLLLVGSLLYAAAIALYEGLGFSVVGERRRFYRHPVEDALLMQIVITKD